MENNIKIDMWYLDSCDQAATLFSQLYDVFPLFWSLKVGASDNSKDVIVLINFSQSILHCTWIGKLFIAEVLRPSIAIEKCVSNVEKRHVPISLVQESTLAVELLSSATKLCSSQK